MSRIVIVILIYHRQEPVDLHKHDIFSAREFEHYSKRRNWMHLIVSVPEENKHVLNTLWLSSAAAVELTGGIDGLGNCNLSHRT
jgi:hypothetical protein